jgi:hypothetical protein
VRPWIAAVPLVAAALCCGCGGGEAGAGRTGATAARSDAATPPHADVVRACDANHAGVGRGGVTAMSMRQALHVGPASLGSLGTLKLWQVPDRPIRPGRWAAIESIVVVEAGADVTIAVPRPERRDVGLIYDQNKFRGDGAYRIAQLDSVARFVACTDRSFNHGLSQYDGGIVTAGRRCFTLDFYIRGRPGKVERRVPSSPKCAATTTR